MITFKQFLQEAFKKRLTDAEIRAFITTMHGDDSEIAPYFVTPHKGILKKFKVEDLDFGYNVWPMLDDKVQKYIAMPADTSPPILVLNMRVIDGSHRMRAAVERGDKYIYGYDITPV